MPKPMPRLPPVTSAARRWPFSLLLATCRLVSPCLLAKGRHVHPGALAPALETELGQLNPLGALAERPGEHAIRGDMAQERLPLHLEGVLVALLLGHLGPARQELHLLGH